MNKAFAQVDGGATPLLSYQPGLELICRTDSLAALRAAVDHGAHSIRLRWRKEGPGIDEHLFQRVGLRKAVDYASAHGCRVCLELGPHEEFSVARSILARAFDAGINEVGLSSMALALYLRAAHPAIELRVYVDDATVSSRTLSLLNLRLGVTRAVLPRVVTLAQIRALGSVPGIGLEVQGWGAGCAVLTGRLANGGPVANAPSDISVGGDFACNDSSFASSGLDRFMPLDLLADLLQTGVRGLIIEAPCRSPARMAQLVGTWREAVDRQQAAARRPACSLAR